MKLNIEKEFVDKISGELHKVGDIIKVEQARGEELLADTRNLVSICEEKVEEPPKAKKSSEEKIKR